MNDHVPYQIHTELWRYPGRSAWYFLSLPTDVYTSIRSRFRGLERGWRSFPVIVTIGGSTWKTSIFPDTKTQTYLLPVKKSVRVAEQLKSGDTVRAQVIVTA